MKRLVCVLGSPKENGNGGTIAKKIAQVAESLGAQTQTFHLHSLNYRGCYACMGCKSGSDVCVINDDLAEVLTAVREADALVMTSPIYFGQISGQLKSFIDRTFSFLVPDFLNAGNPSRLAPGKKCLFVLTQGQPDPSLYDVGPAYEGFFKWFGYETRLIRGLGMSGKADDPAMEPLLKQAEEMAKTLVAGL